MKKRKEEETDFEEEMLQNIEPIEEVKFSKLSKEEKRAVMRYIG